MPSFARTPIRVAGLVLSLVLASAVPGAAQERVPPVADSLARVRVIQGFVSPERLVGTLVSLDSQSVVVERRGRPVAIPLAQVELLQVSRGRRSAESGARRGALFGALGGLALGVVAFGWGVLTEARADEFPGSVIADAPITFPLAGAVTGAAVGALSPGERWESVELPRRAGFR